MKITHVGFVAQSACKGKYRYADISMGEWHCAFFDFALESVSHNESSTVTKSVHKAAQRCKIIAQVAVAHDDVFAFCGVYSADKCVSVAFLRDQYHSCTLIFSNAA